MNEHGLTHFDLTKKDFHIKLKKGADLDDLRGLLAGLPTITAAPVVSAATPSAAAIPPAVAEGLEITSPMVGTFYTKTSPEAEPLVNLGDAIVVGQTLCIIEAMKVMNEIQSEISGTVVECLVANGTSVEFGQPLFRVKVS